ncbi:MAG: carbohydrate ABC transporter permease [Candidatus Puniceispirillaceae bacterium]
MSRSTLFKQPLSLRLLSGSFLSLWCLIAAFPILWIAILSFKEPIDSFAQNPFHVMFGPTTLANGKGLSLIDLIFGGGTLYGAYRFATKILAPQVRTHTPQGYLAFGWLVGASVFAIGFLLVFVVLLPIITGFLNEVAGPLGKGIIGHTIQHYQAVWVENAFYQNFVNSLIVTAGVTSISLTVGTLAGYGLARAGTMFAFWILITALVFRALPHSVLVAGYLPFFINSAEILEPLFGASAPTLYGQPWAVIFVLVAINQPFTIWMLRSFFQNIPTELDEAARVDGCTHFQAFRWVIMPVMWPGVITTGLFSFLLAYNDFLVTSLLLDAQNQTMVPAITGYFNRETTTTDQVEAVAAAVSITAPLFLLVMIFQRQIVSGLTAGAVKG